MTEQPGHTQGETLTEGSESSPSSSEDDYAAREQAFLDKLVESWEKTFSDERLDSAFDRWVQRWDAVVEAEEPKKDAKTKADEKREPEPEPARNLRPGRRRALLDFLYDR